MRTSSNAVKAAKTKAAEKLAEPEPAKKPQTRKPKSTPPALPPATPDLELDPIATAGAAPPPKRRPRDLTGDALRQYIEELARQFIDAHTQVIEAFDYPGAEREQVHAEAMGIERALMAAILRLHGRVPRLDSPLPDRDSACGAFAAGKYWVVSRNEGMLSSKGQPPTLAMLEPKEMACLANFDDDPAGCPMCGCVHINAPGALGDDDDEVGFDVVHDARRRFHDRLDERYWTPFTTTIQDIQRSMCSRKNMTLDEWIAWELEDYDAGEPLSEDWVIWQAERCLAIIRSGPDGKGEVIRLADPV
jgi:hypothetical protein